MYEIILTNEWEYNVLSLILTQEGLLDVCWWNMWFAFCFVVKAEFSKLLNMIFIEMMVHANEKKIFEFMEIKSYFYDQQTSKKKIMSFHRNQNWEPLIYNPVKFID